MLDRTSGSRVSSMGSIGDAITVEGTANIDTDRLGEIPSELSKIIGLTREATVIWQGFDYGWEDDPHRLNRFDSHLDSFGLREDGKVQARYITDFDGGSVEDVGNAVTRVAALKSQPFLFTYGYASAELENQQGLSSLESGPPVSVTLPSFLGPGAIATPVLRGFDITSANFPKGFHSRGFSVRLDILGQTASTIQFAPRFSIHAERSPDPSTREPFTAAPDRYRYSMTAYYTVVQAPASQARFTTAPNSSPTAVIRYEGPTQAQQQVTSHMIGQADGVFSNAVMGIRAFSWQLHSWPTDFDGRYLRRLQCFVSDFGYNRDTGEMTFISHLWFSNKGRITLGFDAEHRLWTTLIQYNDNRPQLHTSLENVVDTRREVTVTRLFML